MENIIHNCTDGTSRDDVLHCFIDDFTLDGRVEKVVPYDGIVPVEEVDDLSSLPMGPDCPLPDGPSTTTLATTTTTSVTTQPPPSSTTTATIVTTQQPTTFSCGTSDRKKLELAL